MLFITILVLLLATFFGVIVLPLFLQDTEKLTITKQKKKSRIKGDEKKRIAVKIRQNRLKEIEQDFDQGKIDKLEYQKLILAIEKII